MQMGPKESGAKKIESDREPHAFKNLDLYRANLTVLLDLYNRSNLTV